MFLYLLTYVVGFFSSIMYQDYSSIHPEINLHLNKIRNENKEMSVQLQLVSNKLDEVINRTETRYNLRARLP